MLIAITIATAQAPNGVERISLNGNPAAPIAFKPQVAQANLLETLLGDPAVADYRVAKIIRFGSPNFHCALRSAVGKPNIEAWKTFTVKLNVLDADTGQPAEMIDEIQDYSAPRWYYITSKRIKDSATAATINLYVKKLWPRSPPGESTQAYCSFLFNDQDLPEIITTADGTIEDYKVREVEEGNCREKTTTKNDVWKGKDLKLIIYNNVRSITAGSCASKDQTWDGIAFVKFNFPELSGNAEVVKAEFRMKAEGGKTYAVKAGYVLAFGWNDDDIFAGSPAAPLLELQQFRNLAAADKTIEGDWHKWDVTEAVKAAFSRMRTCAAQGTDPICSEKSITFSVDKAASVAGLLKYNARESGSGNAPTLRIKIRTPG